MLNFSFMLLVVKANIGTTNQMVIEYFVWYGYQELKYQPTGRY